jgi:hypothetical protein
MHPSRLFGFALKMAGSAIPSNTDPAAYGSERSCVELLDSTDYTSRTGGFEYAGTEGRYSI